MNLAHKSLVLLLDAILRFPTVIGLLFFASLLFRDQRRTLMVWIGILLAISLAALFISSAPETLALPYPLWAFAKAVAAPNLALLWWFGRSLLDDDFKLGIWEWIGFFLLSANNLPFLMDQIALLGDWERFTFNPLAYAVPVHLIYLAITGWRHDLIETRRTFRIFLLGWIIISLSIILLVEDTDTPQHLRELVRLALSLPAIWFVIFVNTQIRSRGSLFLQTNLKLKSKPINDAQNADLQRLLEAVESKQIFLDPELTLPSLSTKCGMTEYRMRKLINEHLGFSNFPSFLNTYRIDEAKQQLAQSDKAITTIAFDCGFKTLSTFNRAFKKIEGVTPTMFRENSTTGRK